MEFAKQLFRRVNSNSKIQNTKRSKVVLPRLNEDTGWRCDGVVTGAFHEKPLHLLQYNYVALITIA